MDIIKHEAHSLIPSQSRSIIKVSQKPCVENVVLRKQCAAEELRGAVEDWQAKHSGPEMPLRLTTGFLDGTSPVVDIYELKVVL